jgi:hypothetical protein
VQSTYILILATLVGNIRSVPGQELTRTGTSAFIEVDNGGVTARFQNQPLHAVCDTFAAKGKISIVLAGGVEDRLVSLDLTSAALDVALRQLLTDYDTFIFYGGVKGRPSSLRAVWVFPRGGASDVRPVGPSDWAGVKELEATLDDSNTEIREAAYHALLERPDGRSRALVVDAIRGIRERDTGLRARLLSNAIAAGFPFREEVLTDLARTDPSEHIRWVALDALSRRPSARDVAQVATTDASEAVRAKAAEILNSNGKARSP